MPESQEHKEIKEKIIGKLREWYGSGVTEYHDSGHRLDSFAVTLSGLSLYVETVWSSSRANFYRDMVIIGRSESDIKIIVVNPKILKNPEFVSFFDNEVISQRKKGVKLYGEMIDGQKIRTDEKYLDENFKQIIEKLLTEADSLPVDDDYVTRINAIRGEYNLQLDDASIPSLEMIVIAKNNPTFWLEVNDENKTYLSIAPYLKGGYSIQPSLDFYEGVWRYGIQFMIHTDGTFHIVMPLFFHEKGYFLYNLMMRQILRFLIYVIRIMKLKKIKNDHVFRMYLKNAHKYPIAFDEFNLRRSNYKFTSRKKEIEMSFEFNPSNKWSELKIMFIDIFRHVLTASGNTYPKDSFINSSLKFVITHIDDVRTQYNLGKLSVDRINIDDFEFPE